MGRKRGERKQTTTIRVPEVLYKAIVAEASARRDTTTNDGLVEAVVEHVSRKQHLADSRNARIANDLWDVSWMKFSNPYQVLALDIKMAQMRRQVLEITGREMRDYLAPVFQSPGMQTEIMTYLGAGDICCTVTHAGLWQNPRKVVNSDLYTAAQEGAVHRGMKLRRVFMLAREDFGPGLAALRTAVAEQVKMREKFKNAVDIRYRDMRKSGRQAISETYSSFDVIRRMEGTQEEWWQDQGCMVVTPRFTACGDMPGLTLTFSEESGMKNTETRFYISRFDTAIQDSRPIEELAQEIGLYSAEPSLQAAGL